MNRRQLSLLSLLVLLLVVAAVGATSSSAIGHPQLKATVGPGYTITLTMNGKKVSQLKSGTYTFVVSDRASIHAFALDGPKGFAKDLTAVPFKGTKTVTLKLAAGKYKYYCPPHEAMMFGRFTVS
jgi:plastocyanin